MGEKITTFNDVSILFFFVTRAYGEEWAKLSLTCFKHRIAKSSQEEQTHKYKGKTDGHKLDGVIYSRASTLLQQKNIDFEPSHIVGGIM